MHPKDEIQNLNLRREVNRRVLFVKRRMEEMMREHEFAQDKLKELPRPMTMPPQWALDAASRIWEKGLGRPFMGMTKEEIEKDPRGCLHEVIGIYEGMMSYVQTPWTDKKAPRFSMRLRIRSNLPLLK